MTSLLSLPADARRVLLVEDSATLSAAYTRLLSDACFEVTAVPSGAAALSEMENHPAVAVLDLGLPDMDGMAILREFQARKYRATPVVVITSNASINTAIAAMREGAFDYLVKPFSAERLVTTVRNAMERTCLEKKMPANRQETDSSRFHGFIGTSPEMQSVYKTVESAARSNATVFITGESGTGKEVCANAIHVASARAGKPFVAINCAAIPRDLMESEVFGHVAGAFTGAISNRTGAAELAEGGTLFLDEICEMDINLQAKLLRLLQSGTFQRVGSGQVKQANIRIVCATNRDPQEEVKAGRFREDLYYRLHVIPLHLPRLRTRGEDVLLIARALLQSFSKKEGKQFRSLSKDCAAAILRHDWPGNVRELQNAIHNAVVLHDGEILTAEMLPAWLLGVNEAPGNPQLFRELHQAVSAGGNAGAAIIPLWQVEKMAILTAIESCDGNIARAAAALDVAVSTIYRKKQEWKAKADLAK